MSIHWFPGHMAKARRQIEEKLKQVDIVIELLDARLPLASRNPMIDEITGVKPRLILFTKGDMADESLTKEWMNYFTNAGVPVLSIDAKTGKGVPKIATTCEQILEPLFVARKKKGIVSKRMRAIVLGIPNVGKSSLINRLAGRHATQTGDRPGVTKAQQWIRVGKKLELLDTPGILWPKFEDPNTGMRLAMSGAIKDEILPTEEVALHTLKYLHYHYPKLLENRYSITIEEQTPVELLDEIGKKRGCLMRGGEIDWDKAADIVMGDLRSGRLGRISLESPEDYEGDADEAND
jgi:ribosome biogenesis GTPase A